MHGSFISLKLLFSSISAAFYVFHFHLINTQIPFADTSYEYDYIYDKQNLSADRKS
jgi:hypothetical protein